MTPANIFGAALEREAKHTPGPWKLYSEQGVTGPTASPAVYWPREVKWCEITVGDEVVAYVARSGDLTEVQHANARLIAAAPELLRIAERFLDHIEAGAVEIHSSEADLSDAVRAAIAKATGSAA
jgi:hypothetical protein